MSDRPALCRSDRLGRPPSAEEDRFAFQELATAPVRSAERALFRLVSVRGMSAASEALSVDTQTVLGWIRDRAVPPEFAERVIGISAGARHTRRGPRPGGTQDPRKIAERMEATRDLPLRRASVILGVSHETVRRWRSEERQRG